MQGKNYLLAGSGSAVAAALAEHIHQSGGVIWATGRNKPAFHHDHFMECDFGRNDFDLSAFLPPQLHGIAYFPGTIQLKPFHRINEADFLQDLQINTLGYIRVVQQSLKALKAAGSSSVVAFTTVAVKTGMSFHSSIALAKGGLESLSRSLAAEYANNGIRFNCIAPSLTDTPLAGNLLSTDEKRAAAGSRHPLGRVGKPEDLAQSALFLLSDSSSWITGQSLSVDGGMSVLK